MMHYVDDILHDANKRVDLIFGDNRRRSRFQSHRVIFRTSELRFRDHEQSHHHNLAEHPFVDRHESFKRQPQHHLQRRRKPDAFQRSFT